MNESDQWNVNDLRACLASIAACITRAAASPSRLRAAISEPPLPQISSSRTPQHSCCCDSCLTLHTVCDRTRRRICRALCLTLARIYTAPRAGIAPHLLSPRRTSLSRSLCLSRPPRCAQKARLPPRNRRTVLTGGVPALLRLRPRGAVAYAIVRVTRYLCTAYCALAHLHTATLHALPPRGACCCGLRLGSAASVQILRTAQPLACHGKAGLRPVPPHGLMTAGHHRLHSASLPAGGEVACLQACLGLAISRHRSWVCVAARLLCAQAEAVLRLQHYVPSAWNTSNIAHSCCDG